MHYWINSFKDKAKTFLDGLVVPTGSSWVGLSTLINTLISFVFNVYITHHLSKDQYGIYQYIFSISGFISNFTLTGLKNSITQSVARKKNRFYRKIFLFSLKTNLIVFLAFAALSIYYKFIRPDQLIFTICFILALCQPITISSSLYEGFLQGQQNFKKLFFLSGSLNSLVSIGTAILLTKFSENILYGMSFSIISRCLITLAQFKYVSSKEANTGHDDFQYSEVKKQALHFSISSLLGGMNTYLDKIVMNYYFGFTAVAEIAIINYLPNFYRNFSKASHTVLLPHLAKKPTDVVWKDFGNTIFFLFLAGTVVIIPISFCIPFFINWFFPKYSNNIFLAQLSSLEIIFLIPGIYLGSLIKAKRKNKQLFLLTTINGITKTFSIIIFGKFFGVTGIVYSKLFSSFFSISSNTVLLIRSLKIERENEKKVISK